MKVIGKIEKKGFGFGVWTLVTDDNTTYELKDCPPELEQEGIKVEIEGKIREDVMTMAMIGKVLEVQSHEIL
ncbi:hypothetical protein I4641_03790 [Waterburya agarophytonicola K14]|uniref:Uncharacterized protein n=1 Tax=Waterburya agarophytonicola KI4 TaxID=2874699 RepID=A0A964BQ52_9CYAN|nr:hypothetical protein [Waterburya agarophytonicola]MCC0176101.1 hypothetical protein [Waterburya agarophytonicola KI4]